MVSVSSLASSSSSSEEETTDLNGDEISLSKIFVELKHTQSNTNDARSDKSRHASENQQIGTEDPAI